MPMSLGERGPRRIRLWEETRPRLGRETVASGRRRVRVWDMKRMNLGRRSPTSWDAGFATCVFWRAGRRISLLLFEAACGEKPEILNVGLFFVVSLSLHPVRPEKKYHYFRTLDFYMKYLTRFAVAMLMASPAMLRAQSVSDSTSTRESVHDWLLLLGMPMCSPPIFRRLNIPVRRSPWPTVPNGWRDGGVER